MKIFTLLLFLLLLPFNLQSQNTRKGIVIEEPIFINYNKQNRDLSQTISKFNSLGSPYNITSVQAPGLKKGSNKKCERLNFEFHGLKLYCAGTIKYTVLVRKYNSFNYKIYPSSDIFYQSNNQLFCSVNDVTDGSINSQATLYNENGSYLYHETINDDKQTIKAVSQKNKDQYNFIIHKSINQAKEIYSEKFGDCIPDYSYGEFNNNYPQISPYSKDISTIELENGDRYTGFPTVGTYHSKVHGDFTGYMFPMQKTAGNASVLFRELDGKYDWVLIVDNQIEMTLPAKAYEIPQFDELMNNLENTIAYTKRPKVKLHGDIHTTFSTNFGVYRNKNSNTLNGYGVNFVSKDSIRVGDSYFLEVGFFKDGKLDGLGYSCKMKSFYNKPITKNQYFEINTADISVEVNAVAGIFKDGKLIKGRTIHIDNDNQPKLNFWSKNKIEGADWIIRENFFLPKQNIFSSINLNQIKSTDEVHVKKLGYTYYIKRIDLSKKAIVIENDGKEVYLNKDSGPVYLTYVNKQYATVFCNPSNIIKTYKEIDEIREVPGYTYDTRIVRGVYTTTYYTTKTKQTYTHKKTVFDKYQEVPCPICNGTGSKKVDSSERVFQEIIF